MTEVSIRTFDGQEVSGTLDDLGRATQLVKGVVGPVPDQGVVADNDYRRVSLDVVKLCQKLINRYHEPLQHARIGLLFRYGTWTSKGKEVWGKAEKVSGKWRAMAGDLDFVITLNEEVWSRLPKTKQTALLDHELMHCAFDPDELKASIRSHDIEEFHAIITRYGAWKADVEATEDAFEAHRQLRLDLDEEPRGEVVAVEPDPHGDLADEVAETFEEEGILAP